MDKDGLQLRSEVQIVTALRDVERLDAHAIAREYEPFLRLRPQRNREHPTQARKAFRIPLEECVQHGLGVAVGLELMSGRFQFFS